MHIICDTVYMKKVHRFSVHLAKVCLFQCTRRPKLNYKALIKLLYCIYNYAWKVGNKRLTCQQECEPKVWHKLSYSVLKLRNYIENGRDILIQKYYWQHRIVRISTVTNHKEHSYVTWIGQMFWGKRRWNHISSWKSRLLIRWRLMSVIDMRCWKTNIRMKEPLIILTL